ncbi:ABC transporter ATP-binding protein [Klebsiella aerogenes]|nr:ABC transporter ATP-binding protein [Klebsiella aerogenes]ELY3087903.1 ABC transporter ATP-binding protein [Klebsiella aerogenes]
MITFSHVTKRYPAQTLSGGTLRTALAFRRPPPRPAFTALEDVSFHLRAGEALGILGHNGAGKSTLLKLLTRVTRPTTGHIRVHGRMSSLLEVGAGFHHDLSGRENIFLAGAMLGMSPRRVRQRLDAIIAFAGLENDMRLPVRTYSSGMFLRLAFSVGVHLDSDILVIDEALAVGDHLFRQRCLARIQHFRQQGGTLVLVSHDDAQLAATCSQGLVLSRGRLTFRGGISDALHHYHTQEDV